LLGFDSPAHRLYVAAESGWVTVLELRDRQLSVSGGARLADGAHVVVIDPNTHHSYYPIPKGQHGHRALIEEEPLPQRGFRRRPDLTPPARDTPPDHLGAAGRWPLGPVLDVCRCGTRCGQSAGSGVGMPG
jgi:hypothetical protein